MNSLFKKLNTLVKASINDLLGDDVASNEGRRKPLSLQNLGKNIDGEIAALRRRVNEAVAYESELQARVQSLQKESDDWDRKADEAVANGQDAAARYAVDQMKRAQQREAMADSDLREHQVVTQELIQRVNLLEATVADARRVQASAETASSESEAGEGRSAGTVLSDVLRDAREKITRMGEMLTTSDDANSSAPPGSEPITEANIEDDLTARRERLSKPK